MQVLPAMAPMSSAHLAPPADQYFFFQSSNWKIAIFMIPLLTHVFFRYKSRELYRKTCTYSDGSSHDVFLFFRIQNECDAGKRQVKIIVYRISNSMKFRFSTLGLKRRFCPTAGRCPPSPFVTQLCPLPARASLFGKNRAHYFNYKCLNNTNIDSKIQDSKFYFK